MVISLVNSVNQLNYEPQNYRCSHLHLIFAATNHTKFNSNEPHCIQHFFQKRFYRLTLRKYLPQDRQE